MEDTIKAAIEIAFEAGKWAGQVELETHYDKEQYSTAILEAIHSQKTAMPIVEASTGKTVTVNLRSNEWRQGVVKSADKHKDLAVSIILNAIKELI